MDGAVVGNDWLRWGNHGSDRARVCDAARGRHDNGDKIRGKDLGPAKVADQRLEARRTGATNRQRQMSTYIKRSEISRFNTSDSTDWFSVSPETAKVVAAALDISKKTKGAFDITVAPLVNLWSFGPERRERAVPSDEAISAAREQIGYRHLHVQLDPPAIRKDKASLSIDLSSIAKGHGVDRVVAKLGSFGCNNVFVNIGGEIAATGDKGNGVPWMAGVERPDELMTVLLFPVPVEGEAIATSGDYRNFFPEDGVRYSHTIDPRTGRPVTHNVATVSVVAENCMLADAWATALNVLGPDEGVKLANELNLDTYMLQRAEKRFVPFSTGRFDLWSQPVGGDE